MAMRDETPCADCGQAKDARWERCYPCKRKFDQDRFARGAGPVFERGKALEAAPPAAARRDWSLLFPLKCSVCGHPLWAPQSQALGKCSRCATIAPSAKET